MSKKTYIIFGVISVIIFLFLITLITSGTNNGVQSNKNDGKTDLENKYTKKEIKLAQKRSDLEMQVDDKIQSYIKGTVSPKSQENYDESIKMRSKDEQKSLKRNVQDLIKDDHRKVQDLTTETSFKNSDEIEGTYSYTLTYKKDGNIQSEDKEGEYTLATNDDGYFYIKTFN